MSQNADGTWANSITRLDADLGEDDGAREERDEPDDVDCEVSVQATGSHKPWWKFW